MLVQPASWPGRPTSAPGKVRWKVLKLAAGRRMQGGGGTLVPAIPEFPPRDGEVEVML